MDCKHEIDYFICEDIDGRIHVEFGCFNKCNTLKKEDIVILTKEQHDKMKAVVGAVIGERRLWNKYNAIKFTDDEDARLTAAKRDRVTKGYVVACQKTDEALEAYEG